MEERRRTGRESEKEGEKERAGRELERVKRGKCPCNNNRTHIYSMLKVDFTEGFKIIVRKKITKVF